MPWACPHRGFARAWRGPRPACDRSLVMSDDALDPRTVQELRTYADGVIRPIDAMTIAETAIAGQARLRVSRTTLVFLAAALILAVAATVAIEVGTRPSLVPLTTYRGVLVPAPDLLVPRGRPLLVMLADGRVLIAGGDGGFSTTTAEVFDPATGRAARPGAMVSADHLSSARRPDAGRTRAARWRRRGTTMDAPSCRGPDLRPGDHELRGRRPHGHAARTGEAGAAPGRSRPRRRWIADPDSNTLSQPASSSIPRPGRSRRRGRWPPRRDATTR